MQLYTLTTPMAVVPDSISAAAVRVTSLEITGIQLNSRPPLAPLGTATLVLTLTDPTSGFQEAINMTINPVTFWASVVVAAGQSVQDAIQVALFGLLTAANLLPAGTLSAVAS